MLSNKELDAIKERCDNATEGYWRANYEEWPGNANLQYWVEYLDKKDGMDGLCATVRKEDAEFIAHAKEDIPKLLAEVERLREWNGRLLEYNRYYFGNSKRLTDKVYELEDEINELINRLDEAEGLLEDASDLLDDMYPYDTETYADITDYFEKHEPITRRDE